MDILKPYYSKIKLISGDIHQFVFVNSTYKNDKNIVFQEMISSGITKDSSVISEFKLRFFFQLAKILPKFMGDWIIEYKDAFIWNNYGVIEIDVNGEFKWFGVFRDLTFYQSILQNIFNNLILYFSIITPIIVIKLVFF
jgi:hypothetical protein